jgi:hypothetical protein
MREKETCVCPSLNLYTLPLPKEFVELPLKRRKSFRAGAPADFFRPSDRIGGRWNPCSRAS